MIVYSSSQLKMIDTTGQISQRVADKLQKYTLSISFQPTCLKSFKNALKVVESGTDKYKNKNKILRLVGGLSNALSAIKNATAIHDTICLHKLDYLAVTETWFSSAAPPRMDELVSNGYGIINHDRLTGRGEEWLLYFALS